MELELGEIRCSPEIDTCMGEDRAETTVNESPSGSRFTIDRTCIPTVSQNEQERELHGLDIQVYQQEVLEKEILQQVDRAIENQRHKRAGDLAEKKVQRQEKIECCQSNERNKATKMQEKKESINFDLALPRETEKERKIRMGEMTPFGTVMSPKPIKPKDTFENIEWYLKKQMEMEKLKRKYKRKHDLQELDNLKRPRTRNSVLKKDSFMPPPKKKKIVLGKMASKKIQDLKKPKKKPLSENTLLHLSSDSEYMPESDPDEVEFKLNLKSVGNRKFKRKLKKPSADDAWYTLDDEYLDYDISMSKKVKGKKEEDDGIERNYLCRLEDWEKCNSREEMETQLRSCGDGFKVPTVLWNNLYNYQRVGVQWLWELNLQRCGGILGDEMGLGKTIQVIAFLASLSVSKLISRHGSFKGLGPVLIVCPTTVMYQWVREFHQWWPQFRVALLHESGTFKGKKQSLIRDIVKGNGILITSYVICMQQSTDLLRWTWHYVILDEGHKIRNPDSQIANVVKLFRTPHRLILSGSPMQNNLRELWSLFDFIFPGKLGTLPVFLAQFAVPITQGGYINASKVQVATAYKCATVLRDTISPYLLRRVKEDVKTHINLPPKNEQVLFCRLTDEQKELYVNYLNSGKVDDILSGRYKVFVGLTELRKICNHPHLYTGGPKIFKWVKRISAISFVTEVAQWGMNVANHSVLFQDNPESVDEEERFGFWKKAGKMIVVETLLKLWKKQGHRVLIFTQSRQMLRILETFVQSQKYEYIKMDGATNIRSRQPLINKFNEDKNYYIFLSTTHVGGLGVNLTGANRVVIYDPDWNPATDTQARERAWRIGQENQVTIYRLVTSGTIEEKIYHRQIFKQFITNKVLKDPSQRRFFKSNDLYELFTYKDSEGANETSAIFAGTGVEVNLKNLSHRQKIQKIKSKMNLDKSSVRKAVDAKDILTKEKIEKMKQIAQTLSKQIALEAMEKEKRMKGEEGSDDTEKCPKSGDTENRLPVKKEPRERRKKHKRKRNDAMLEGEVVPHLQKQIQYGDLAKEATSHEISDDYILKKLFSKSGVQSALKHDQIMQEGSADYVLIEGEAERVAKEAVKALKESRKQYMGSSEEVHVRPSTKPRFGKKSFVTNLAADDGSGKSCIMTSAELLQRIRQRNGFPNFQTSPINEHSELLTDIRNFISFGGERESKATTQEIVDRFRDRLPASQTPLFKALLQEICEFHRMPSGEGVWELQEEFHCGRTSTGEGRIEVGECESFWLVRGPPFDQRDYMISPSESPSLLASEKSLISTTHKKKLKPSDIQIDSKYLYDSQKALKKILELVRDGLADHLTERLKNLIEIFLQGSPPGFLVDALPSVIEIVEFFSRNRDSVPEFSEFVKTLMCFASEPPKIDKASDMLHCKQTITDYFTLLGELLATFDEKCFQYHLLGALDGLLVRRKLVDVNCIKLACCHEAMEESQLPCIVAAMLETVPISIYLRYLDLALQMVWVSIKAGYAMIQNNVIEFVLQRLDPLSSKDPGNYSVELLEKEDELNDYYQLLDKSAYLVWGLFAIVSKYSLVDIPVPGESALWSLKYVFHREARKGSQKATDTRNNLAGLIAKLIAVFGERLALIQTGLVVDIAMLSVATEIKPRSLWLTDVSLGPNMENYTLKKLMLLCCCMFAKNTDLIQTLKDQKVVEGILCLINPKTTVPWIPSQFTNLLLVGLRTLSELVPRQPETYLSSKGNERLLSTIVWLKDEQPEEESLLEALKTFCRIISCDVESVIGDAKAKGAIEVLLDLCFRLLDVPFLKLHHQEKLSRIFIALERLVRNDKKVQTAYAEACVSLSVKLLERLLANSEKDSKWSPNLLVSFGGFLWEGVAWCSTSLKSFIEKGGIFLLLDFVESSCFPVQLLFLGNLVDMTDEGETIAHLLTWRGRNGCGILSMMIDIWRKEEFLMKVHRTNEGLIKDVEAPLMTEEQWYLTHQVREGHAYSPSVAEMVCSVRPKVHALYQFLQRRYFTLTQVGESIYCLQMKTVKSSHQVYIPLIEHFLALKMGEIWFEVIRDANISGILPTKFDGEVVCTLIDEKNKWAARIKRMQEEILLIHKGGESGEEKKLYNFLRSCRLPSALEAMRELDYVARTSFQKFQKQKKEKQMKEVEMSIGTVSPLLNEENIHRTFSFNTKTTFLGAEYIWVKSEKYVATNKEDLALVSPESCGDDRFDHYDNFQ